LVVVWWSIPDVR